MKKLRWPLPASALIFLIYSVFPASAQIGAPCNMKFWEHVYTPKRLEIVRPCAAVRGVVLKSSCNHYDGDRKLYLKLDPEFENLLNAKNMSAQRGLLVVEIVCDCKLHLKHACRGFSNPIHVPKKGDYVEVSGSYVKDLNHGWMEIHPATSITVLKPAGKP